MSSGKDEHIRKRAYELWESEGRPDGREGEHWARAVRELEKATAEPSLTNDPVVESETLAVGTKAPKAKVGSAAKKPVKRAKPAAASAPKSPKPKASTSKASTPKSPASKSKPKK